MEGLVSKKLFSRKLIFLYVKKLKKCGSYVIDIVVLLFISFNCYLSL